MYIVIEKDFDEIKEELFVRLLYAGDDYKTAQSTAHQQCKIVMESDLLPDGILFMGQSIEGNHRRLTSVYETESNVRIGTVIAHAKPKKLIANTRKPDTSILHKTEGIAASSYHSRVPINAANA